MQPSCASPKAQAIAPHTPLNAQHLQTRQTEFSSPGSFLDKTGHPLPTQTIHSAQPTTQRGCPVLSGDNVTQTTLPGYPAVPATSGSDILV